MKKIICDKCKSENARSYKYPTGREIDPSGHGYITNYNYIDLCINCLQEFVLNNKVKLIELQSNQDNSANKTIIYG